MENIINLNPEKKKKPFTKILLMGNKGSGKTSIKSIIFQQKLPNDTIRLAPTNEIEEMHVKIMGNLNVNIIDCCSKEEYIEKYFTTKKEKIFSEVDILIFVIDISKSTKEPIRKNDLDYLKRCIEALKEKSPDAKIYIFINKMDLLEDNMRNDNFFKIKSYLEKEDINNLNIIFLATSIWDISLYKAWTYIISEFIPKKDKMKELLKKLVSACGADEAVLLEKNILIKICSYNEKELADKDRFEKITEVIKKFKQSCKMNSSTFKEILIKTANNVIYIDEFENSTYIIVALRNQKATLELIKLNIEICKNSFKELFKNE